MCCRRQIPGKKKEETRIERYAPAPFPASSFPTAKTNTQTNFSYNSSLKSETLSNRSSCPNILRISSARNLPAPVILSGESFSLSDYIVRRLRECGTPNILTSSRNPESIKSFVTETGILTNPGRITSIACEALIKEILMQAARFERIRLNML